MSQTDHPFVPGARVAVHERYGDGVTEAFVEKIYKNGRFTLRGSKQQWSPWPHGYDSRWRATETGRGWQRRSLDLWDDSTNKEISAKLEASRAKARWRDIYQKVGAVKNPTNAMCDAIEAALALSSDQRGGV